MDARHDPSKTSVYVDVPLAPYAILHRVPSTLKENEPWRVSTATMDESAASSSLKRKLDYSYQAPNQFNQFPMTYTKKPKLFSDFVMVGPTAPEPPPPSYIYCHQCGKKREKEVSAHCSYVEVYSVASDRPAKTRRCHNKYCKSCLKNRYNEDIDAIKANTATNGVQDGHLGEPYEYKCPKCRDVCNCSRCRKAKGLDPTGKFTNSTNAPAEKQPKPVIDGAAKTDEAKAKRAPRQKAKAYVGPLPTLKWTKLRTNLSVEDAEARFHIREFVLRFFSKALPKAHLDELEHIGGNGRNRYDEEEIVPWVSEACLKSILLAFLGVLAEEETNDTIKKAIQMGSKEMRPSGVGLAKIWQILASLRDALDASEPDSADDNDSDESDTIPSFPDPLPLPDSAINGSRRTRSTGSLIIDTVQMIPSTVIRTDIDKGAKESKDVARDVKDATRNANDMWDKAKKETENVKEQEVAMNRFNPRFAPLGGDRDGRLYYALSPGASDIESAFEFISSMATETDDASQDERSSLKEWSWFVAVWGKKPPPDLGILPFKPIANGGEENGDESDDDEVVDKWWAIWQPAEIRKLATWITLKYRLNENTVSSASSSGSSASTPSSDSTAGYDARALLTLVANLDDYAMGLEFRVRDGEATTTGTTVDLDKGKARAA
ncbi:hypothetical protein B0H16DRAFT_1495253 [Mycena metata]|uniref:Zinc-finger domain-containing protein n=1 Tax=Mycena metata TaxID=1033252 RepID=A0AAD7KCU0_9AGAR|nr:hypothetical protein B0H16DRAFT_1495253 [Mycena metata]